MHFCNRFVMHANLPPFSRLCNMCERNALCNRFVTCASLPPLFIGLYALK
jgi:hypothetical protein